MPTNKQIFETNIAALNDKLNEKANTTGQHTIAEMIDVADSITGGGITPTGNINITNMQQTNVTNYATAQVVDANLVVGNIKNGTTVLGLQGTFTKADSVSSGQTAAAAGQILSGYSAWVNGVEVQGSIVVYDGTVVSS